MKFETTPAFDSDYRRLKREHAAAYRSAVKGFARACDGFNQGPGFSWPAALRVSPMKGTSGIWEMTWSFSSPDGRATFEFIQRDGDTICRWRRVGDHGVYRSP